MLPEIRRILFVSATNYFDDSNGATVASRAMLEALSRQGFVVGSLTGTTLELGREIDHATWIKELGLAHEVCRTGSSSPGTCGPPFDTPPQYRLSVRGVDVTLYLNASANPVSSVATESKEFLLLLEMTLDRFRPDVLVSYGGDPLAEGVRTLAKGRGCAIVFALHNFSYGAAEPFATADAVIVPSRFAASHYRKTLGLSCTVLPNLVDLERVSVSSRDPRYVTFVNPSYEKGVYVLARIADELGRRRPEIPLLVVEGRGSERTLADCGLDLRAHGNVNLMGHTHDPRQFWGVTRVCLMPSLWWENQPLAAVEAMVNGIPVIGSDRGGLPETLGSSGLLLPLPARLSPVSRELPTAEEVTPWVEVVIRLWDDAGWYAELSRRALSESRRWDPVVLEPRYGRFFSEIRAGMNPPVRENRGEQYGHSSFLAYSAEDRWNEKRAENGGHS